MCAFVRAAVGDVGKKRAVERKICGETTERREQGTRGGVFLGGTGFLRSRRLLSGREGGARRRRSCRLAERLGRRASR